MERPTSSIAAVGVVASVDGEVSNEIDALFFDLPHQIAAWRHFQRLSGGLLRYLYITEPADSILGRVQDVLHRLETGALQPDILDGLESGLAYAPNHDSTEAVGLGKHAERA